MPTLVPTSISIAMLTYRACSITSTFLDRKSTRLNSSHGYISYADFCLKQKFLDDGDKVKATIFFRGREMTRTGLGRQILERLIKDVEPHSIVEFRPRQEGNTLHAILAPKKSEKEREKERQKAAAHSAPSLSQPAAQVAKPAS